MLSDIFFFLPSISKSIPKNFKNCQQTEGKNFTEKPFLILFAFLSKSRHCSATNDSTIENILTV